VGRPYLELAEIYEKSFLEKVRDVLLPSAAPFILTAIRTSLAFAWVIIFFVEYASARQGSEGLGWFIADSRQAGKIEEEFAGLLFLGLVAFAIDSLLAWIERGTFRWVDTLETQLRQDT
jgi:ABC-type nitrate/sulfonate/bicarbonate transport system permease component